MWKSLSVTHFPLASNIDQLIEMIRFEIIQMDEEVFDVLGIREDCEKLLRRGIGIEDLIKFYNLLSSCPKKQGFPMLNLLSIEKLCWKVGG